MAPISSVPTGRKPSSHATALKRQATFRCPYGTRSARPGGTLDCRQAIDGLRTVDHISFFNRVMETATTLLPDYFVNSHQPVCEDYIWHRKAAISLLGFTGSNLGYIMILCEVQGVNGNAANAVERVILMAHIFLVAGAPAVGKSTTAHALAAQFEKSIHISVDNIREMVVSGLVRPSSNWNQYLIEQLALARESAIQIAVTYNKAGFVVVIDDFWDPNSQLLEYSRLFQEPNVHKILLFPSQQVAEARNLERSGSVEGSKYIADGIRTVYESLKTDITCLENQGWIIADTSEKNVEVTVEHILAQVR